ncbi:MAG: type II toxin-antitoxin system VapC family toxin [SAR202 cluster bacterium]|nr:type II toxin-antitoxin system VapC family toxin [SAR202 cluster bacterium]
MVLDASALLAVLKDETGKERVIPYLSGSAISTVNLSEALQKVMEGSADSTMVLEGIRALGLSFVPFSDSDAEVAALLRGLTYRHGLSFGDRACLALGLRLGLPVLTTDKAWSGVSVGVEVRLIR